MHNRLIRTIVFSKSFVNKLYLCSVMTREIRLPERRFFQKITDIYATAMNYNIESPITSDFDKPMKTIEKQ